MLDFVHMALSLASGRYRRLREPNLEQSHLADCCHKDYPRGLSFVAPLRKQQQWWINPAESVTQGQCFAKGIDLGEGAEDDENISGLDETIPSGGAKDQLRALLLCHQTEQDQVVVPHVDIAEALAEHRRVVTEAYLGQFHVRIAEQGAVQRLQYQRSTDQVVNSAPGDDERVDGRVGPGRN